MRSRHLSLVVNRSPEHVSAFASDPENLPKWAAGLAQSDVTRDGDSLLADSPMGRVRFTFVPPNDHGVLDHDVTLPSGETVNNPFRVIAHPEGSELIFTLRDRDRTNEEFDRDTDMVRADLERLKALLER
ncbi:SRPBCC family protein [Solicola gregarius]|uniref:SRPBCC family protein n=1 Tax=Solicola gregarius TaxID=2908642 RepID=A0AA46TFJ7_9ACTN|nr:SRPBCC family protein [Solicola gregarius]UYM04235.1 SRPBCC family protein [Solicola gregarius]